MTREQQERDKRIEKLQEIKDVFKYRHMSSVYDATYREFKDDYEKFLLDEVSRLQVERDEWKAEAYKLSHVELERDKAIESLKSLAYDIEHNLLTYDEVKQDCLRYLSELGVPHDPLD